MKPTLHLSKLIIVVVLLFAYTAAIAQSVRYNATPGIDFSKYKTYKWVRIENAQYPNQIIDEQIKASIDRQLASKGLAKVEDSPDLVVVYQAAVNSEKQWNAYSTGGSYWGWGGWGGMGTTTMTSSTINVGSLDVDIYDVSTKKQIWRGEATKTLGNPKSPEKIQKNIDKATRKLMKNYPPPRK